MADDVMGSKDASWTCFNERLRRLHRESQLPLGLKNTNLVASNASLKRMIDNLEVNNDFARFKTERIHQSYADSVKARYLSPKTAGFSIAHEQIQELLHLLGEERDLTNSLQDRLDQEIMMSHGLEVDVLRIRILVLQIGIPGCKPLELAPLFVVLCLHMGRERASSRHCSLTSKRIDSMLHVCVRDTIMLWK